MENTRQAGTRNEDLLSPLDHSGSNMTMKDQRITMRQSKESLREMLLSEWPYFMEGLQLVQEDVIASTYSMLVLEPHQYLHLGTSNRLKECIFRYLASDVICIHSGKLDHERTPLSRMWTSLSRAVSSILVSIERHSSLSGH